jgi:hypothetical protein
MVMVLDSTGYGVSDTVVAMEFIHDLLVVVIHSNDSDV